jgi:hypothetical protein
MSHAPLHPDTRNLLAREILKAREAAEAGAKASLAALRVGEASSAEGMSAAERSLRNRLRANGRQLGDNLLADGKQELGFLVEEIAYQHWHRMLFARFLAENGLLREDQGDQPIDLAECEALATAEGLDIWAYAARCAQKMLPGIFRLDDPKLELRLDTPKQLELNAILKALPSQVFTGTDALGWVYQYWQAKRKDEVNASGVKIGAKELSPVTQLFTEDYMVDFLLHNTLGAWWAGKQSPIEAATEEEARAKAGLPAKDGLPAVVWTYLRFVQDAETKKWTPAGGTFEGWPKKAKDITFLDPCMGSGHFPVFALPILARMRMEEGRGTAQDNIRGVLKDQIHGLELDQRCCQIGAFNLALTAWKLAGLHQLPDLNIACCGVAPRAKLEDWVKLAGNDDMLKSGMIRLHKLFEQAPVLGSLINLRTTEEDLLTASYKELRPLLETAFASEVSNESENELVVAAKGISRAAELLSGRFTLVATNVPFLRRGAQSEGLRKHIEHFYSDGKADLATAFIQRCLAFLSIDGSAACVSQQHFLYLGSYKDFRGNILRKSELNFIVRLGSGAFEALSGENATVALSCLTNHLPDLDNDIVYCDAQAAKTPLDKARQIRDTDCVKLRQYDQVRNPDSRIGFSYEDSIPLLSQSGFAYVGLQNGDTPRFVFSAWEVPRMDFPWAFFQLTCDATTPFGGREGILRWEEGRGELSTAAYARVQGAEAWGRKGVAIRNTIPLPVTLYSGDLYDQSSTVIIPKDPAHLLAIWAFCTSSEFFPAVQLIDGKRNKTNHTYLKVPFNLEHWEKVGASKYPNGLPKPSSSDPKQWLFAGYPFNSDNDLQVAVARLLCYQWPRQTGSSFPDCSAQEPDGLEKHADDDGIVALSPINREEAAAARLRALLKDAYGAKWKDGVTERQLLADAGHGAATLEEWLRDSFFEEHCKLFYHRPFIWHIWDGEKDGFHVLVNYHRLAAGNGDGTRLLQKLATTYLGDWIARCNQEVVADKPGAARRLKAAQDLQVDLRKILEGEAPNDIFVRWKPLREQAIGWAPDINDGVRLNIRPFLTVRDVGKKGAGLLRFKPNINWGPKPDRGNDIKQLKQDFPWLWSCNLEANPQHATDFTGGATFTGERWNNLHYTLAVKKAARNKTSLT